MLDPVLSILTLLWYFIVANINMASAGDTQIITLLDAENNRTYNLLLSVEDYQKAIHGKSCNCSKKKCILSNHIADEQFASALLNHAKATEPVGHSDLEEMDDDEEDKCASVSAETNEDVEHNNNGSNANTKSTYMWKYDQVLGLINSMGNYTNDLDDPRKRKDIYEHVANELLSMKYEVNATMVQNKWKSLLKSYRKAKDNKKRTGRGPARFHFYEAMDAQLGKDPTNASTHSLNSLDTDTDVESSTSGVSVSHIRERSPLSTSTLEADNSEAGTSTAHSNNDLVGAPKRRTLNEKKWKQEYITLKKEEAEKREKRHAEKLEVEKKNFNFLKDI
jgi:hypothetical protein